MLFEKGEAVTAYVRPDSYHPTLDALPIDRAEGDINDPRALRQAMRGCDVAIHTAFVGRYTRAAAAQVHLANEHGTQTFLECCLAERIDRVVVIDTISSFASSKSREVREPNFNSRVALSWMFPYLRSKLGARETVQRYRDRLSIVTLHCSPMYGAGDKHGHTGGLIHHLASRRVRVAPPGGTSVVAVADAANACILATNGNREGEFVVASEHLTFLAIYRIILEALGSPHHINREISRGLLAPAFASAMLVDMLRQNSWFCPYMVRNGFYFRYFSSSQTQQILGWEPRVSLQTAIREQIEWMRGRGEFSALRNL